MAIGAADILLGMGYILDADFIAFEDRINWISNKQQPTAEEIDFATLPLEKATKINYLKQKCKLAIESGFYSSALGALYKYDSALPQDQSNLIGAKVAGVDMNFTCTDSNGIKIERFHTAQQMAQVFNAGMVHIQTNKANYYTKVAEVNSAMTIAELDAVIW